MGNRVPLAAWPKVWVTSRAASKIVIEYRGFWATIANTAAAPTQTIQARVRAKRISLKQAARLLNYSEGHVLRLIRQGILKSYQRSPQCPHTFDQAYIAQKVNDWGR